MSRFIAPLSRIALAAGLSVGGAALAAPPSPEFGTVISSTPVVVQTTVPRQQCVDQPGYVQTPTSGGGAVVGGILGGLAGNAIGAGAGRALATGVGAIAGAVVGNNVEASNTPPTPVTTTNCVYSRSAQSQVVGYDVVYEFNGQRYTTRTARDPGARIALDVRPAGETSSYGSAYDAPPLPNVAQGPGYPVAAPYGAPAVYPAPYTDTSYGYPPFNDGYYGPVVPAVPVYIEGRFGGRGRHWH